MTTHANECTEPGCTWPSVKGTDRCLDHPRSKTRTIHLDLDLTVEGDANPDTLADEMFDAILDLDPDTVAGLVSIDGVSVVPSA